MIELARDLTELKRAVADELRRLGDELRNVREQPFVTDHLDMQGKRIINAGRSKGKRDLPTRSELQELAMYENEQGQHVAHSTIVAPHGIRSKTLAKEQDDLVPLRQVRELVAGGSGGGAAVVTSNVDQYVRGDKLFAAPALTAFSLNLTPALAYHNQSFSNTSEVLGTFLRITGPVANFTISGLQRTTSDLGGAPGMVVVLWNKTNVTMVLQHDVASIAENRFLCPNNTNITVSKTGCITVIYSDFDKRWVVLDRN